MGFKVVFCFVRSSTRDSAELGYQLTLVGHTLQQSALTYVLRSFSSSAKCKG